MQSHADVVPTVDFERPSRHLPVSQLEDLLYYSHYSSRQGLCLGPTFGSHVVDYVLDDEKVYLFFGAKVLNLFNELGTVSDPASPTRLQS